MKNSQYGYIKQFFLTATLLFALFGQSAAQITTKDNGGLPEAIQSFQGSIRYNIRLSGKHAADIMLNEPATKMDMHIKDDNFIVNLYGGQKGKTFLFIGDSNHTYIIDASNARYFLRDYYVDTTNAIPTAEPVGTTEMVKKWECDVYKVTKPGEVIYYYVNDKFRVEPNLFSGKEEAKANFLTRGLDGRIPLKTVIKQPGLTTEIDLDFISEKELEKENFQIPEGFKRKVRDPRM